MHDFYSASSAYGEPGHARDAGRLVRREHSALLPNGENLPPSPPEVHVSLRRDAALATMTKQGAGAVIVLSDSMLFSQRTLISDLAAKSRLPAIAWTREE